MTEKEDPAPGRANGVKTEPIDKDEYNGTPAGEPGQGGIDVHQVRVAFFRDEFATNLKTAALTLPELRDRILKQTAQTKKELPWLKLASFGKSRTKDKSLRHDANVTAVEGLELDYDG